MPTDTIRGSPYEKGLYFVGGTYGTAQWQVGTRYTLEKVLGHGGFSSVCLANDHQTGEKVALKRIPDVLSSPENAKRVLREVCILRRVTHPNIIGIRDCFVRPSATGQCRLVNGKLVNISIDVYIAMEFAEGGDLFHLKGQMSADEVKSIMWQLTYCIKYLHDLHVWHRDLKSQNVFVSWEGGQLVAKLGDFGSARSAIPEGYSFIDPRPPSSQTLPADAPLHSCPSYDEMHRETRHQDIYLRYEDSACGKRSGFKAPLTRVVATPCYRAPEVVMSRGGYSAAIDVWGLGCILGELLQRVAHVGSAATPHLQVAPLFAIHDMPKTPTDGDQYIGGPGNQTTRIELQALFDVIGTPAWADVAAVELPAWRNYLHRLPGRAPTLYRRFGAAGEVAIDLLKRMLSFDPWRRCTADEVLAHEYFGDFMSEDSGSLDEALVAVNGGPQQQQQQQQQRRGSKALLHSTSEQSVVSEGAPAAQASPPMIIPIPPAAAAAAATAAAAAAAAGGGSVGAPGLASYRSRSIGAMSPPARLPPLPPHHNAQRRAGSIGLPSPPVVAAAAAAAAVQAAQAAGGGAGLGDGGGGIAPAVLSPRAGSMGALAQQALQQQAQQPQDVSLAAEEAGAAAGAGDVAMSDVSPFQQPAAQQQQQQAPEHSQHAKRAQQGEEERIRHYWEEKDPARALGMLEDEMATITAVTPGSEGCQKLRALLELECEAIAASHGGSFAPAAAHSVKRRFKLPVPEAGVLSGLFQKAGPGLQLDTAGDIFDPSDYGAHRLSNVADTWQVELDPEKYLGPQRHGEWTAFSGAGPPPGPRWGVTATPPGMDEASMDPRMAAVIKAQQLR